jgi:SAM-dependent methyltransferase
MSLVHNGLPHPTDPIESPVATCHVCGSAHLKRLGRVAPAYRVGHDRLAIVECRWCGLSFSDPLPDPGELAHFYAADVYSEVYGQKDADWQREQHRLDLHRAAKSRGGRLGRLLDVGCGYGLLLEVATELGWDAYGVELNPAAAASAAARVGRDRVVTGTLQDLQL